MSTSSRAGASGMHERIHTLLQDFYIQRRKIRSTYEVGELGISEAQILMQAFAEPGVNAKRLAQLLHLEKSTVSRTIAGLVRAGHVKLAPGETDQREKQLSVTESGARLVKQLQESNNKILRECLRGLTVREQYDLAAQLRILADGLECTPATYLPGDHPLTLEIVRLGRGTGMTGSEFVGSAYSSTQYHLLRMLQRFPRSTVQELRQHLPLDPSTVFRTLSGLREKGLVILAPDSGRAESTRSSRYMLSKKGEGAVNEIDKKGGVVIEKALRDAPAGTAARLCDTLGKVVDVKLRPSGTVLQERLEARELSSLEERQQARGLFLDPLIRSNEHFATPDDLFSPRNRCFGLFQGEDLVAACELVDRGSGVVLSNISQLPQLEKETIDAFHKTVRELLKQR